MKKLITYFRYLSDYLRHGDWLSVWASVRYVVNKSSHSKDRMITTSVGTFFCRKNTNDFQFANWFYEWGVKSWILKHQDEFSVFIDGGACVGDYSILLTKMNKRCIAFEPVTDNVNVLRKNLELNDLQDKVMVFPYGLGDNDYTASFNLDPVNTGASRINKVNLNTAQMAEVRKIDSLMDQMKIDQDEKIFFKLDVEGMEAEAIRGATQFILNYPHLTFIIEDKHSGEFPIQDTLSDIALFEFGKVDELNLYAKKIRNY